MAGLDAGPAVAALAGVNRPRLLRGSVPTCRVRVMSLGVGEQFAGYTIVRLLGTGGMGEVYLAKHPRLPRHDALKILPATISNDPDFRARFEREADLAATLWHPHIVGVHDRGEHHDRLWIAMDYVEGSDTAKLCRDHHPDGMPAADVLDIVDAIADALDYAHGQQLLHRDVKPANILLTEPTRAARRILLADFGIARDTNDTKGLTATNTTVGSVYYAAPEQLMDEPLDGRADQYALAATAYHLLTGTPPFAHTNSAVVISRHLNTPPPRLADTHPHLAPLDTALTRAMSKNPEHRYPTTTELAQALHRSNDDADVATSAARPAALPEKPVTDSPTRVTPAAADDQPTTINQAAPVTVSSWGKAAEPDDPTPARDPETSAPPSDPAKRPGASAVNTRMVAIIAAAVVAVVIVVSIAMVVGGADDRTASTTPATTPAITAEGASPDQSSDPAYGSPTRDRTVPPSRPASSPISVRPPGLVQTPDSYQERCGEGYTLSERTGWAARGGRGSTDTSCYFAYSVLRAYWDRYGTPSKERRQVIAEGTVPCDSSNALCRGADYVMTCQAIGADPWITCTGGRNARVYLF